MSTVIEVDDSGVLRLPSAMLPVAAPHTRYIASKEGDQIILVPAQPETKPFWQTASPEERVAALQEWLESARSSAGLSDYAVSRDSIYE